MRNRWLIGLLVIAIDYTGNNHWLFYKIDLPESSKKNGVQIDKTVWND